MKQLSFFKDTEIFSLTDKTNRGEIIKQNPYLGPRSERMGYHRYLDSEDWKRKKKFAIQLADYKCEDCEEKGYLEVHHSNYKCLYHERFDDVHVLCRTCHIEEHEIRRWQAAYRTYMEKKYGEYWEDYNSPVTRDEFDLWLEAKEREEYG